MSILHSSARPSGASRRSSLAKNMRGAAQVVHRATINEHNSPGSPGKLAVARNRNNEQARHAVLSTRRHMATLSV